MKVSANKIHNLAAPTKNIGILISSLLTPPGQTPTTSDRMGNKGGPLSAEKRREKKFVKIESSNDLLRKRTLLYKSYSSNHRREWAENVTYLKCLDQFTVLVVDDVPDQVTNAIDLLTSWNEIACEGAYDGLEAVKMVRSKMNEGKAYHLILTDLTMPHDGFETTKDIRKEESIRNTQPRYCIIGVTAEGLSSMSDIKSKQSGMDDTITKPLRRDVLANIITKRAEELGIKLSLTDTNY